MRYSELDIHGLPEGQYTVGKDKVFVPYAPGDPPRPGTLFVSVTPFVIRTPNDVILMDCGLGEQAVGRSVSFFLDNLRRWSGLEREDVTKVLLSHLHFDHVGGAVYTADGQTRPTFPRAAYFVQRGELEAAYQGRSDEIRASVVEALDVSGQLVALDGDGWITPEIEHRVTGGHTAFHQAFLFNSGGRTALFGGDVLPTPSQINRRFLAKYDHDPEQSRATRSDLTEEALENGYLLLFYHSTQSPAGFITGHTPRGGYQLEPVEL